jgi:hypothetical protein
LINYQNEDQVQEFLDKLQPMESFNVTFIKNDSSTREMICKLEPDSQLRKKVVNVMTDDGWRAFNITRVLSISKI